MPTVYRRGTSQKFHKAEDCRSLTKRSRSGFSHPVETIDLDDLSRPAPCLICYPDAPRRPEILRRYCRICAPGRTRPCEHNGGVKVTIEVVTNYVSLLRDPGDTHLRSIWVWPDSVRFYEPIASQSQHS